MNNVKSRFQLPYLWTQLITCRQESRCAPCDITRGWLLALLGANGVVMTLRKAKWVSAAVRGRTLLSGLALADGSFFEFGWLFNKCFIDCICALFQQREIKRTDAMIKSLLWVFGSGAAPPLSFWKIFEGNVSAAASATWKQFSLGLVQPSRLLHYSRANKY